MGLMDMVSGLVGGKKAPKTGNSMIDSLLPKLLASGALAGMLKKFSGAGMGDKVDSWVGKGPNQPISGDEVEQALGADEVQQLADKAGMSTDETKNQLAAALPNLVDQLTPDGKVPDKGVGSLMKGLDVSALLGSIGG
jgi:uncharacterized protein YidB (DUF937 family)